MGQGERNVKLWDHREDGESVEVQLDTTTGQVDVEMTDRAGDWLLLSLTAREARALGVALVNGTAPWSRTP